MAVLQHSNTVILASKWLLVALLVLEQNWSSLVVLVANCEVRICSARYIIVAALLLCVLCCRLLLSIKESVQQLERSVLKEVAFQEGVRYGQRLGSGSLMLSVAAAAAAASAATAFIMMRQSSK